MFRAVLLIASLAVLAFAQPSPEYFNLDAIPGVDFVGFGYDARFQEPKNALTLPMLDFAYTKGKTYVYPTDPDTLLRVPDQLYVRTVAYTEADAYLYHSIDEVTMALQISLGFGFDKADVANDTKQSCITTRGADGKNVTNCTTSSFSSQGKRLSIGVDAHYYRNTFENEEVVLVENTEKTQLYNIFLDSYFVRATVKDDIIALGDSKFSGKEGDPTVNPKLFIQFIEKWGTHYVVSAVMGGQVRATSLVKTNIDNTSNELGVSANVQHVSDSDALTAGGNAYHHNINIDASFNLDSSDRKTLTETTTNWFLIGGDSNSVNLLDASNSSTAILSWKKTIVKNPVPVGFRLREVGTLFSDFLLRAEMSSAIFAYLQFDTKDLIALTLDLATNKNKIDLVV
jgi:hypothetical protein